MNETVDMNDIEVLAALPGKDIYGVEVGHLVNAIESGAEAIATLRVSRDAWKHDAGVYADNAINLRAKLAEAEARVKEISAERDFHNDRADGFCGDLEAAEAKLSSAEKVVEAAKIVDRNCPEGFDGQDAWTNEAHRKLHAALVAYEKSKEGR